MQFVAGAAAPVARARRSDFLGVSARTLTCPSAVRARRTPRAQSPIMASSSSSSDSGKKSVLFVCLGNICRSPAAEATFKHYISEAGLADKFEMDSCGIGCEMEGHVGDPPDRRMRAVARERGIPLDGRARQFVPADFEKFDLILCADAGNKRGVMSMDRMNQYENKVKMMTEFVTDKQKFPDASVPDPYYQGNFSYVFDLLTNMSQGLLESLSD